jgi:hypothetical protein
MITDINQRYLPKIKLEVRQMPYYQVKVKRPGFEKVVAPNFAYFAYCACLI